MPASPNDKRQLHRVEIKPQDVAGILPEAARAGLNDALGPPREIFIGPTIETARIRWLDERAADIERIFGAREGEPNLQGLVVNEEADAFGAASINRIARAAAAQVYAQAGDRIEGTMSGLINPNVRVGGRIKEVDVVMDTNGKATCDLELPPLEIKPSLFAFLDESQRKILHKLPQAPAGPTG